MPRSKTRLVTGFVTSAFVGFGAVLAAPAASADTDAESGLTTLDTFDETEFSYHCATSDGADSDPDANAVFAFSAPEAGATGESIEVLGDGGSKVFYYPGEELAVGDATITVEFALSGEAAPQDSVSFSASNTVAFTPTGDGDFDEDAALSELEPVALDLTHPGTIDYVPGTITYELSQATGESITVCEPSEEVSPIASTEVTGEPVEDDDDEEDEKDPPDEGDEDDDKGEDDKDDKDGGDKDGKDEGDGKDEADEGGLPVTGAALTGLVAAAVAAVGGGSAAMYFSRRRASTAGEGEEA